MAEGSNPSLSTLFRYGSSMQSRVPYKACVGGSSPPRTTILGISLWRGGSMYEDKLKKVTFYWSDRWQRVINIYKCDKCGREFNDLLMAKPKIERLHNCIR